MVAIRTVSASDLAAFRRLYNTYVDRDASLETVRAWYEKRPELLLGAYEDGRLVGHCLGRPGTHRAATVELAGIAVVPARRREGIGTALLEAFERRARERGFERVSLGSAGGYVDTFYVENGYTAESVLVRYDPDERPADEVASESQYEIVDERLDGDTWKRYVDTPGFDPDFLEAGRASFDDPDAIFIMAKGLGLEAP